MLRHVAGGLTDRAIDERLSISRRTASHHVASILTRLGVHSRQAAAEQARHLGLSPPSDPRLTEPPWSDK